jgi:hypothetical protein
MRRDSIVMRDYVIIGVCVAALAGLSWGAWMLRRPHELAPREAPQATVDAPRRDTLAAEAERARREARPLPQVAFDLAKLRSPVERRWQRASPGSGPARAGQAPQANP